MKKRLLTAFGVIAVLLAVVGYFVRAEQFRERIHRALEQALHRKVDIGGKVTFSIWNGPGFSIGNVWIHEDPAEGIEPFAFVTALDASVSLPAMLMGRWEVNTITLDEPTVTLAQSNTGSWNVKRLVMAPPDPVITTKLPEIRVRSGRINVKFGDTKSVLYFMNADLDLTPQDDGMRVRFSMEPARTDRPAQGFGTIRGRGRYLRRVSDRNNVDLDLDLERRALSEIATLLQGRGGAFRGFLAARAKVQGPLDALRIEGSMRVEDIQRWDLLRAATGNWPLQFHGQFNFPAGELDLETTGDAGGPFRLRLLGHALLENPSWGAIATCNELPVSALRDLVQYLGVKLPERVVMEGKLSGVLGYSRKHGLQGMMGMPRAAVKAANSALSLREARIALDGDQFRLLPTQLVMGTGPVAEIEGSYAPGRQVFAMRTGEMALALQETLAGFQQFFGASIPMLSAAEGGTWRGVMRYERDGDEEPVWNGQFALRDTKLAVDGLSAPVHLKVATGQLNASRIELQGIKGTARGISFAASYRKDASAHPHKLDLVFEELETAALESLLEPTLRRSSLLRTLSFRDAPIPSWLKDRHLQASVQVDALWAGDTWLGSWNGRLLWDAALVRIQDLAWEREDSEGTGALAVQLNRAEPAYRLTGEVLNFRWKGGAVDGEVDVSTNGMGIGILRNARSLGKFAARDLSFPTENDIRTAAGKYELSAGRGAPLLRLDALEVASGGDVYTGRGGSEADGKLIVDLASGRKKLHISGTLWPFQLDVELQAAR
ncbi:MAG: AsmA family protein [Acidobacteria bacterium]|nr:AsmA family protein [Acidobacteriota bacterium]